MTSSLDCHIVKSLGVDSRRKELDVLEDDRGWMHLIASNECIIFINVFVTAIRLKLVQLRKRVEFDCIFNYNCSRRQENVPKAEIFL
jgi:hypothetical protein